jgi:hypothetical protein
MWLRCHNLAQTVDILELFVVYILGKGFSAGRQQLLAMFLALPTKKE